MNWETLEADKNLILSVHYSKGRYGRSIEHVVIHYNAGNLTTEGCYSVWQTREASAHYQVEADGTVGQLVWDSDTAWHASNWDENCKSIGIEHANRPDGTVTAETLEAGAHLTAALCKFYGLGRPEWEANVWPHWDFAATSCPGELGRSQRDEYMGRAQAWYDAMCAGEEAPAGADTGGAAETPQGASEAATEASDDEFHGGLYRCTVDGLRIRKAPSLSGEVVEGAAYDAGETVELDDWYEVADGYVWGRYTGATSGELRYVAVGKATGQPEADDYLVRA